MTVHIVKSGESLWSLSKVYRRSIKSIMQLNGLISPNSLVIGQALYIPDNMLPSRYYRIKFGDNLWQLAQTFSTNVSMIISTNPGINPNLLMVGQVITIPSPNKLEITNLGFTFPDSAEAFFLNSNNHTRELTYLAIVAYSFTDKGFAYNVFEDKKIISKSKQLHITPLLLIRNFLNGDFSAELAGNVLERPTFRQNLILSLVNLVKQRGFGGVSIDFEFIPPQRRQDFTTFLKDLKTNLGDLVLHVNVHAKTNDMPTNRIVGAHDYAAIGKIADIVAVMTIDYGYPTGPPDPVAPIWWIYEVVRYSITQISPSKLQIAFPLYGYDKVSHTTTTKALSVLDAQNQAISTQSSIQFDSLAMSPWYRYWHGAEEHIVWFEDIRSYIEKYKAIDVFSLLGATYWHLGLSAPQQWAFIRNNLTVKEKKL